MSLFGYLLHRPPKVNTPVRARFYKPQHGVHIECKPLVEILPSHEITLKDDRSCEPIGEIVIADRGDRYVELHRIDAFAEYTLGDAAVEDRLHHRPEWSADIADDHGIP